ncbi:DNA primase [Ramlibacter tataouinensis]|uniref:DNA primase n=1 Tax=Ramlibacter tataouinensis TaxID=94132 RepID=UPI0022F3A186|nr:DNA primase [Ramlibacter tataouinensis]WBY01633.1 DNA primase [Ramlibacter tataouinensis]
MAIPQSFIQELLARADVVEIVGRHVQLKKAGANFQGLCPFHSEKTPSFTVSPTKQFYHCFGCGQHGSAIGFLMEHAGMGFVEAVKDLAGQYGLQVPEDDRSPQDREQAAEMRRKQATLGEVLEKAGSAWRKHLKGSPRAIEYLKRRGLSGEIARHFGLGYAPQGWRSLASVFPDYDDPLLAESGLVIVGEDEADPAGGQGRRYDRFRDRIMFPIRNVKGECIGFGGRVLGDEKPKYLNSPETPVFSKGRELYGLYEARHAVREAGYVLVTEGYMDVVALAQLGFPHAVATLGTACTPEHVQKLFRFTDSVVFSFDGDAAGRRAARRALESALPHASDTRSVKFLFLPPEHDPDSFVRAHGQDEFLRYVRQAVPLSVFLLEATAEDCDLSTAEGRSRMLTMAQPLWAALPDGALKRQLFAAIAERSQVGPHELAQLWRLPGSGAPARRREREPQAIGAGRRQPVKPKSVQYAETIARLVLRHSRAWEGLTQHDHEVLCRLQAPLGDLFCWLDAGSHEHGGQPWAALQAGLQGLEFAGLAERLMAYDESQPISRVVEDIDTTEADLRLSMLEIHLDLVAGAIEEANRLPQSNPERVARLLELSRQQQQLLAAKRRLRS